MLQLSWSRGWKGLQATGDGIALRRKLIAAYEQPKRKYHTLQHLKECIALLRKHLHRAKYPAEVEIALWFHDAVYDGKAKDNEARSANWAAEELGAAQVIPDSIERIKQLILATSHSALPVGQDQQLLVDIDLAILGSPRKRFTEYEGQVREEYRWVPYEQFLQSRISILTGYQARNPIYNTESIRLTHENQAHENLANSLKLLEGKPLLDELKVSSELFTCPLPLIKEFGWDGWDYYSQLPQNSEQRPSSHQDVKVAFDNRDPTSAGYHHPTSVKLGEVIWIPRKVISATWSLAEDDCRYSQPMNAEPKLTPRHIHTSFVLGENRVHIDFVRIMSWGPLSGIEEFLVFVNDKFHCRGGRRVQVPAARHRHWPLAFLLEDQLLMIHSMFDNKKSLSSFWGLVLCERE